jgi:hypothetical protein
MRCPVCRAEVGEAAQCRRCRADLSLLVRLAEQRRRALQTACVYVSRGDYRRARAIAEGADTLHSDAESRRLLAVVHLLCREHSQAWRVYQEVITDAR